jgi:hypothetical protein
VFGTERVLTAGLHGEMIRAERDATEVTVAHAMLAACLATLRTGNGVCDQLPTARTLFKAIRTIGLTKRIALVETRPHLSPTVATDN